MFRKLMIVFASAAALCVASLALAWVVGGDALRNGFSDERPGWNWAVGDSYKGPKKSREFAFDGGSLLTMSVPVNLHFTRGDTPKMVVSGPAEAIDRLDWSGQRLSLTGKNRNIRHGFDVTIVAPRISGLKIQSAADVNLAALDQESFDLYASGAVDLVGSGRVGRVLINTSGASDVDLTKVKVVDAKIVISGAGDVDLAASGAVDVRIAGAGDVTLHRKPRELRKSISGFGSIKEVY